MWKEYLDLKLENMHVQSILNDKNIIGKYHYVSYVISIVNTVHKCRSYLNNSFLCLSAPSCTGKTQFSLALDCFSEYPFFPISSFPLHEAHSDTSLSANLIVEKDSTKDISLLISGSNLKNLKKLKYTSLGFLKSLIRMREADNKFGETVLERITWDSFYTFNESKKPIIVCMDEFGTSRTINGPPRDLTLLFFGLNLLREAGCVVFTMGTNSKAANLIEKRELGDTRSGGREIAFKHPWVYLLTIMPRFPFGILKYFYPAVLTYLRTREAALQKWLLKTDTPNSSWTMANEDTDPLMISSIPGFVWDVF
jgi:hypothetical protein